MKDNLKDIINSIPDFDDFLKLADEIGELAFKKMQIDNYIKAKEAEIVRVATTDQTYFIGGKPPSMAYIESTFKQVGFDGNLTEVRNSLADISAQLEKKKIQLSIYRDMLEVFRTISANSRVEAQY